jgi:hypothetical protein
VRDGCYLDQQVQGIMTLLTMDMAIVIRLHQLRFAIGCPSFGLLRHIKTRYYVGPLRSQYLPDV